jgi:hypothetical protein
MEAEAEEVMEAEEEVMEAEEVIQVPPVVATSEGCAALPASFYDTVAEARVVVMAFLIGAGGSRPFLCWDTRISVHPTPTAASTERAGTPGFASRR